jgi:hypothetical protein
MCVITNPLVPNMSYLSQYNLNYVFVLSFFNFFGDTLPSNDTLLGSGQGSYIPTTNQQ